MAFGRRTPQSYGVPVRSTPPGQPLPTLPALPSGQAAFAPPAPAHAGGFYAPLAQTGPPSTSPYAAASGWAPVPASAPYPTSPYAPLGYLPAPPGHAQPPPSNGSRNVIIGVLAAVVGLPMMAAIAIPVFLNSRHPKLPSTLAGRDRMDDAALRQLGNVQKQFEDSAGTPATLAIYQETGGQPAIVVVAARGRINEQDEIVDAGNSGMPLDATSRRVIGDATCYSVSGAAVATCLWSGDVSGMVIVLTSANLDEAAAIAEEAKRSVN